MKQHLKWLGLKARDRVTGFTGIVSSISFDLYGCVCAVLTPPTDKVGKPGEGHWFDVKRLEKLARAPVMAVPDFEVPEIGAAEKPVPGV